VALDVKGGTNKEGTRGRQGVRRVALTNAADASWFVWAVNKGAKMLEEDVFESRGRGFFVRVQERGVIGGETTQREFPKVKRWTTSPVGVPELSRGRKASKSSKGRTERNRGIRKIILDDLRTG
jgi:hypothetical protein